jgi:predicted ester cyclase
MRVAARVSFTGTQRGPWKGIQPTGRSVRVTEMFMCRLESNRLTECWQEWDEYGLRQQLTATWKSPS